MRAKSIIRPFLLRHSFNFRSISSFSSSRIPLNLNYLILTPKTNSSVPKNPFPVSTPQNLTLHRPFSDFPYDYYPSSLSEPEPPPVPENIVPVKSEEEFDAAVSKAEGESVPAVFYFTATWCAPCRFIGPVMDELARRNPHVTTYKMDIDEPTVHFFKEGKKEDEVVGADVTHIVQTMKKLYEKKD
ncbi:thioredoxin O1, mitochondrial-like isoform X2 [Durio zibethinus]|uniref:Thioredoxin O1, mitochondrial-like isoform X2 n=1 Tax=Durio zibethinus TaxID=66656 RepID=A0A6P6BGT6_DURZI|nr:thioredoxin O1, mitochondrial-like isoform X2 [Durio zibethinus]